MQVISLFSFNVCLCRLNHYYTSFLITVFQEKLIIARHLSLMGVDVCEAGFPIASPGDFEAVAAIASEVGPLTIGRTEGPMRICGLSRANEKDIDRCYQVQSTTQKPMLCNYLLLSRVGCQTCSETPHSYLFGYQ